MPRETRRFFVLTHLSSPIPIPTIASRHSVTAGVSILFILSTICAKFGTSPPVIATLRIFFFLFFLRSSRPRRRLGPRARAGVESVKREVSRHAPTHQRRCAKGRLEAFIVVSSTRCPAERANACPSHAPPPLQHRRCSIIYGACQIIVPIFAIWTCVRRSFPPNPTFVRSLPTRTTSAPRASSVTNNHATVTPSFQATRRSSLVSGALLPAHAVGRASPSRSVTTAADSELA